MRKAIYALPVLALMLACQGIGFNGSVTTYINPSFSTQSLAQEGMAMLPLTGAQNIEGLRRPLAEAISIRIAEHLSDENFSKWDATAQALNDTKSTSTIHQALDTYWETGLVDRDAFGVIQAATGKRYALLMKVERIVLTQKAVSDHSISAPLRIFDCELGDIAWEGVISIKVTGGAKDRLNPDIYDLIARATAGEIFGPKEAKLKYEATSI